MADQPKGGAVRTRIVRQERTANLPGSSSKKKNTVTVSLRIPASMLKEIDRAVKARPYKIPRHSWLLEAVHEKLARLKNNDRTRSAAPRSND
jgi:hypothetical protein